MANRNLEKDDYNLGTFCKQGMVGCVYFTNMVKSQIKEKCCSDCPDINRCIGPCGNEWCIHYNDKKLDRN